MAKLKVRFPTAEGLDDIWQRRGTAAAIEAARDVVKAGGAIMPGAQVGRLGDIEWGWIVAAVLFAWIKTCAEQATAMEIDTERAIRMTGLDPNPWDAGAIAVILPELADAKVDWTKPLAEWPKEVMIDFLLEALRLIRKGMIARDLGGGITRKSDAAVIARHELNDPIGVI